MRSSIGRAEYACCIAELGSPGFHALSRDVSCAFKIGRQMGTNKDVHHGELVFTVASFFLTIAASPLMLIAFRAIQGLGAAMLYGTGLAILVAAYPLEERGRVLGINVASVYLGLSIGPFIGGILTQNIGWRSVFFLNVPFGLVNTLWVCGGFRGFQAKQRVEGLT